MPAREQLTKLLTCTVEIFREYRDTHRKTEEDATAAVVQEALEGLDAEGQLWVDGGLEEMTSQKRTWAHRLDRMVAGRKAAEAKRRKS